MPKAGGPLLGTLGTWVGKGERGDPVSLPCTGLLSPPFKGMVRPSEFWVCTCTRDPRGGVQKCWCPGKVLIDALHLGPGDLHLQTRSPGGWVVLLHRPYFEKLI